MTDFGSMSQDEQLAADLRLALQLSENYARAHSNTIFEDTSQRHRQLSSAGGTMPEDSDHSADTLQTSGDGCPSIKAAAPIRRSSMDNSVGSHYVRPESPPRIRDGDYARQSSSRRRPSSSSYHQSGHLSSRSRGYEDDDMSPVPRPQSRRRDYTADRRRPTYQEDSLDDLPPPRRTGRVYQDDMMRQSQHCEERGGDMMRRSQHRVDNGELDVTRSRHHGDQASLRRSRHCQDDMQRSQHYEGRTHSNDAYFRPKQDDLSYGSYPENSQHHHPRHRRPEYHSDMHSERDDRFSKFDDHGRPLPPTPESRRSPGTVWTPYTAEDRPEGSYPQDEDALATRGPQGTKGYSTIHSRDVHKDEKHDPQDYEAIRQFSHFSAPKGSNKYDQTEAKYEPQEYIGVRQVPARKISPPTFASRYVKKNALPPQDEAIFMDIGQGVKARLRRSAETIKAIENDFYIPAVCVACSLDLFCISDVQYLFCPTCKSISPIAEGAEGIGLGFTYETLFIMQSEVMKGRSNGTAGNLAIQR